MRDSVATEGRFGGYVKGSDRGVADVSDFRNDVRVTLRTRDMTVRLVVVDEAAVLGIPVRGQARPTAPIEAEIPYFS